MHFQMWLHDLSTLMAFDLNKIDILWTLYLDRSFLVFLKLYFLHFWSIFRQVSNFGVPNRVV